MKLTYASSPHIRGNFRTNRIMTDVILALMPALIMGFIMNGLRAAGVMLVCVACAVLAEFLFGLLPKTRFTVRDLSCVVTGVLLSMTLPASVPYWLAAVGSAFSILVVKCLTGGLGQNIFNPALAGRAFMMLIFPAGMTMYASAGADAVSSATPLHHMVMPTLPEESILDMFLGLCPGSIGEISALALLLGGAYLVYRKVISARIPVSFLLTVAVLTLVFHKTDSPVRWMLYSLFSGGVMLGAIFMATDYTTSPVTKTGQLVYGIGCGALTVLLRYNTLYPEGVTYAILIMNALVWLIDRHTAPRRYGKAKGGATK